MKMHMCTGLLCLAPFIATAAESCESAFSASGDASSGLRFSSSRAVPGLNAKLAIDQLKAIAAEDDFDVGKSEDHPSFSTLIVHHRPTTNSQGFDVHLRADQTAGTIAIAASTSPGEEISRTGLRRGMCGMLARVDMERPKDAPAPAKSTSSEVASGTSLWETTTPDKFSDVCIANFRKEEDPDLGAAFTTWVPIMEPAYDGLIQRIKALATDAGYRVAPPIESGTQTDLAIHIPKANLLRDVPLNVTFDRAIGVLSFSSRIPTDIEATQSRNLLRPADQMSYNVHASTGNMQGIACMLASFGALATPKTLEQILGMDKKPSRNPFTQKKREKERQEKREQALVDDANWTIDLLLRAISSGKSIVITPVLDLDSKFGVVKRSGDEKNKWDHHAERTWTTLWQGTRDPRALWRVGHQTSSKVIGLKGAITQFRSQPLRYMVYIVTPDTYALNGGAYIDATTSLPQLSGDKEQGRTGIGSVTMKPVLNTDYSITTVWANAQYTDKKYYQSYCTAIIMPLGACASTTTQEYTVKEMTSPAGWRDMTNSHAIDGMAISTELKRPFATVKINPGEVVVMDGFTGAPPSTHYEPDRCAQFIGTGIRCDATEFRLVRVPAKIEDINAMGPRMSGHSILAPLANLFSKATYRAVEMKAKPGEFISTYGQIYIDGK